MRVSERTKEILQRLDDRYGLEIICSLDYTSDLELLDVYKRQGLTPLMTSNRAVNNYMTMQGNDVFRFAIRVMEEAIVEVLKESNLTIDDIDCIIPHQANIRIIKHVARSMNLPMEKVFVNLDKYGNTSSASIGIALSEAKAQGVIKENDKVILVGFGGGFTYSSYLYQF